MFLRKKALAAAVVMAAGGWLASCGGSSGDELTGGSGADSSGDSTNKTVSGRITGFGSVIVNGVHFDTDSATITHDGVAISERDLKVGMIVKLSGGVDADRVNGVASTIEFDEDVKGPIASVDLGTNSFMVLGQTIIVDDQTVFDDTTFEQLLAGNVVKVSGYFDADGALRASLVELKSLAMEDGESVEVKGVIQSLDATHKTFMLRNLVIDYSVAQLEDVPNNTLSDGMFVEVKSSHSAETGMLLAQEIEYEDHDKDHEEGEELELEGLIMGVTSSSEFTVNGYSVLLTEHTEFKDGSPENIAVNSRVEVKGELNEEGVLLAEEVKLRRRGNLRIESVVDSVNADVPSFNVLGVSIAVTTSTVWKDDSEASERYFNLSHLTTGDRVEVRGYTNATGDFVATTIEREDADADDEHKLTGPVSNFDGSSLTVFGIIVSTDVATEYELNGEVSADVFFSLLKASDIVTVEGFLTGSNQLVAGALEVESDDGRNEFGGDRSDDADEDSSSDDGDDTDSESDGTEDSETEPSADDAS